jgi:hypothetical protein
MQHVVSLPRRFLPAPRHSGSEALTLAAALGTLQDALNMRGVAANVWAHAVVHADPSLGVRFSPLAATLPGGYASLQLYLTVDFFRGGEGEGWEVQSWRLGLNKFLRIFLAARGGQL